MFFDSNTFGRKKLKTVGLAIFPAKRNETTFFIFIDCLQRLNTVTTCSSVISDCFFMYEYNRLFVRNVINANTMTPASHIYKAILYKENVVCCSALHAFTSGSLFFVTVSEFASNSTVCFISLFTVFSGEDVFFE